MDVESFFRSLTASAFLRRYLAELRIAYHLFMATGHLALWAFVIAGPPCSVYLGRREAPVAGRTRTPLYLDTGGRGSFMFVGRATPVRQWRQFFYVVIIRLFYSYICKERMGF